MFECLSTGPFIEFRPPTRPADCPPRARRGDGAAMSDHTTFDRLLATLHDSVLDDTLWPACSALIDEVCRIKGSMLSFARGQSQDEAEIYLARLYLRGERQYAQEREYFDIYYPRDEKIPRLYRLPDSEVVHAPSLYTEDEKKTSATYNEHLPTSGYHDGVVVRMDGPNESRIVWSSADPVDGDGWSFDQIEAIRALLPHFRQYVLVRQVLRDARALETSLTGLLETRGLAIVHLDSRGRIVAANERARGILRKGDALLDRAGHLHARLPVDDDALQAALARALPTGTEQGAGGSLMVGRPSQLPGLSVHINPVDAGEVDFRPWRVRRTRSDHRSGAESHRSSPGGGGPRPDSGGKPCGGAAVRRQDRPQHRLRDRPLRKDRPLARAADFRETRRLPADRPRA